MKQFSVYICVGVTLIWCWGYTSLLAFKATLCEAAQYYFERTCTCIHVCVFVHDHLCVYTLRYLPDVTGDGLVSQINNPEVEVDIAKPDVRTRQLIMELRVVTNKLRHAQSGQDMDFMDSKCSYHSMYLYISKSIWAFWWNLFPFHSQKSPFPCSR